MADDVSPKCPGCGAGTATKEDGGVVMSSLAFDLDICTRYECGSFVNGATNEIRRSDRCEIRQLKEQVKELESRQVSDARWIQELQGRVKALEQRFALERAFPLI